MGMPHAVLITQCLQRDFVSPIGPYESLPNRLHVGHLEAVRLVGPDPAVGPVAQLMTWARAQPEESLDVIHIRDWHDPTDDRQRDHLETFGSHCLQGSRGAELILGLDAAIDRRANEQMVDSIALNDFEGTPLGDILSDLRRRCPEQKLRIGVVGVWTEAKVSFLLYDLKTRFGIDDLATCSALTASASRAQHFNALEQLKRLLGVHCFDSLAEFQSWLNPEGAVVLPKISRRFGLEAVKPAGDVELTDTEREIAAYLYRDSSEVLLHPLAGGFSGARVFSTTSRDALGHRQAPSVLKLGPTSLIGRERVAFERVEEILGNSAPSVRGFVDFGERAGIKYSFASMGQGGVRTLKSLFEHNEAVELIESVVRNVFEEILAPLYAAARLERLPLLQHYGFSSELAPGVRASVQSVIGRAASRSRLDFGGGYVADNVVSFYRDFLASPRESEHEFHYASFVHGDLNAANVLLDARRNVWVIDFFHTGHGHALKDLAKLENDLLYILTPLGSRAELAEAIRITRALRSIQDLREPLAEDVAGVRSPALQRAWRVLRVLRQNVAQLCHEDRNPTQMSIALLRYAVHTLTFDESSAWQKQWALAAACGYAEDIAASYHSDRVLRVDWVDGGTLPPARLGMTICPGRLDRGRDLSADLEVLRREGTTRLLTLLSDEELRGLGVPNLLNEARVHGFHARQLPIRDQGVPTLAEAAELAVWCVEAVERGEKVVLHCMGGLGRTGTIASCSLVAAGMSVRSALTAVRASRGPRAVETREQERFVEQFAREYRGCARVAADAGSDGAPKYAGTK